MQTTHKKQVTSLQWNLPIFYFICREVIPKLRTSEASEMPLGNPASRIVPFFSIFSMGKRDTVALLIP